MFLMGLFVLKMTRDVFYLLRNVSGFQRYLKKKKFSEMLIGTKFLEKKKNKMILFLLFHISKI
jgi:hypothetical protein